MATCPKCGYARKPSDTAPEWQCPSCGEIDEKALDKSLDTPSVHWTLFGISLAFTWWLSSYTREWMGYEHYGFISGVDLGRVLMVSLDLYFAGSAANSMLDLLRRPITQTHHRLKFAAGCVALAFALHYTGTLAKAYQAVGLKAPGPLASIGMLSTHENYSPSSPDLPLEAFAGEWIGVKKGVPGFVNWSPTGWISRIRVDVAGGAARMRFWRSCATGECETGSFPAVIQSRRRGTVIALHATGTLDDGTDWLVSLYTQPGTHMMLEEQHNRGHDRKEYHQYSDWMKRGKP